LPDDAHGAYLALIRVLATRTAELHAALAFATTDPAFAPEPITAQDLQAWKRSVETELDETLALLAASMDSLPENLRADATALAGQRDLLQRRIDRGTSGRIAGLKTRYHGDYHLGQVLLKRNDFVIVDFEGEPARPLAERRAKHSPLRDVAGMFRSFAYAKDVAQQRCSSQSTEDCARWAPLLDAWETEMRRAFFEVYDDIARTHNLYPSGEAAIPLVELFEIEKSLYELRYELRNRPQWAGIPLRALLARNG
jgi:maltose alpha-D-glucosyltransferase/alpha-amylase